MQQTKAKQQVAGASAALSGPDALGPILALADYTSDCEETASHAEDNGSAMEDEEQEPSCYANKGMDLTHGGSDDETMDPAEAGGENENPDDWLDEDGVEVKELRARRVCTSSPIGTELPPRARCQNNTIRNGCQGWYKREGVDKEDSVWASYTFFGPEEARDYIRPQMSPFCASGQSLPLSLVLCILFVFIVVLWRHWCWEQHSRET